MSYEELALRKARRARRLDRKQQDRKSRIFDYYCGEVPENLDGPCEICHCNPCEKQSN